MRIYKLEGDAVRILISDAELSKLGADFRSLQERSPHTDRVVRRILKAAGTSAGLLPPFTVSVRATPTCDGCLLLITPHPRPPHNDGIYIFSLSDADDIAVLAAALSAQKAEILSASLFAYAGTYRLLLYCDRLSDRLGRLIGEFVTPTGGGRIAAAHITEYGTPLYIGNALERV